MNDLLRANGFSDNDDNNYKMLRMIHSMAGQLANAKVGGWRLSRTATFSDYILTVWDNGIVEVGAESVSSSEESRHYYWVSPVSSGDEPDDRITHEDKESIREEMDNE